MYEKVVFFVLNGGKNSFYPLKTDIYELVMQDKCNFAPVKSNRRCETFTSSFTYTIYIRKINKIESS